MVGYSVNRGFVRIPKIDHEAVTIVDLAAVKFPIRELGKSVNSSVARAQQFEIAFLLEEQPRLASRFKLAPDLSRIQVYELSSSSLLRNNHENVFSNTLVEIERLKKGKLKLAHRIG